jgi:hypothetical protein
MAEPEVPRRGVLERYPAWVLILLVWFVGIPFVLLLLTLAVSYAVSLL